MAKLVDVLINKPISCMNCGLEEIECNKNCEICNGKHFWQSKNSLES